MLKIIHDAIVIQTALPILTSTPGKSFNFAWRAIASPISNTHTMSDITAAKIVMTMVNTSKNDILIRANMQHMMGIIVKINATTCNSNAISVDEIAAMI
jgi:hypothetical protein